MAKVVVETEDYNALTLVRGLEMFLALNGISEELELGNVSEEVADKIGENYEEVFGEEVSNEEIAESFKAVHASLVEAVEMAVKKEEDIG